MKSIQKAKLILLVLGIILAFSTICTCIYTEEISNTNGSTEMRDDSEIKVPKASRSWWNNFTFIHIDGNWSTAVGYDWCSGDGSWSNPYKIENITMDATNSPTGSGIFINNSKNEYFIISNCTVYNAGSGIPDAGIRLDSTNNGTLLNNNCSYNDLSAGIQLFFSWNNKILGNIVNNNSNGIYLEHSRYNIISGNSINNNTNGVHLYSTCYFNNISNNAVNYNNYGFYLEFMSDSNNIIGNNVYGNDVGINMYGDCTYNTISRNIIKNNINYGIYIEDDSSFNNIFLNKFIDNGVNAYEANFGASNGFNNPEIGNYWDDYGGVDSDKDGIGDSNYVIPGLGTGVDLLPIWDFIDPIITINAPYLGQSFGKYSPVFEVEIEELILEESWYTIDNGVTNIAFSGEIGIIDSSNWSAAPNGHITIRFYARDYLNNIGFKDVIVIKDAPGNLIDVDIIDQVFTETEFIIKFTLLSNDGKVINNPNLQMWWNGTNVPPNNINHLGGGLYSVSLTPIFVAPGQDPILLNMTITAPNYRDKNFETYIAVEKEVEVEVYILCVDMIKQLYSENWYNFTFYVYNASNPAQGIEWAEILSWSVWWNGTDVSGDILPLGGGNYSISLEPIIVMPGEDPISLNGDILATGFEQKEYEFFIVVDPEIINKKPAPAPPPPSGDGDGDDGAGPEEMPLITLITVVGASITTGCAVVFILWKKGLLAKLKRK